MSQELKWAAANAAAPFLQPGLPEQALPLLQMHIFLPLPSALVPGCLRLPYSEGQGGLKQGRQYPFYIYHWKLWRQTSTEKCSGNADRYFFTWITKNRMGTEHCSGMYIREATIISAVRSEISNSIINQRETINKKGKSNRIWSCKFIN